MIDLSSLPNIKNSVSKKLIIYIVLFSSIVTILLTALQLYIDYSKDKNNLINSLYSIEKSHSTSITNSLWVQDEEMISIHLEEILTKSEIRYLAISQNDQPLISLGTPVKQHFIKHNIPLSYRFRGEEVDLGTLYIQASLEDTHERLASRIIIIMGSQALTILLVTLFMFIIFYLLVGQHLQTLAEYARSLDLSNLGSPLVLNKKPLGPTKEDELDSVASSINAMQEKLLSDLQNQKKSAEALLQSEAQFRSVFETSHDAIILANGEGVIISVNKAALSTFGYHEGELEGKSIGILMPERYRDRHSEGIERYKSKRESKYLGATLPFEGLRKDGSEFPLELNVSSWENSDGIFFGGIIRDVSERKKAEITLAENLALLSSLIDSIPDRIFYKDKNSVYLGCNKEFSVFTDHSKEEIVGKTDHDLFPKELAEIFRERDSEMLASGQPVRNEEWVDYPDGRHLLLDILKTPFYDPEGNLLGLIGVSRDITDLKRAEEERTVAYENFKTLVDSMEALIYVADMDTYELLLVNKYGREIWGDVEGQICWQALQEDQDGPCAFCTNNKLLNEDGSAKETYVWEFQNTVNKRWYECRDQAIHWTGDTLVRMEIATDITERKEAEAVMKNLESKLRQSQKMEAIGTLAGGIAHDFNNILVPILAYTEMVRNTLPEESESFSDLSQVLLATNRARELVKQILTFSREKEEDLTPLKVTPIIKETIKLLQASLPSTINIKARISAKRDTVLADPTQLHQILMNLFTNAYHAMRDSGGGTLEVILENSNPKQLPLSGHENTEHLILRVKDTGVGMSNEIKERIFEPYFTTKEPGEGTGLGLAVIHGIVTGMRGEIKVFSEPGQGTTFTVYLPLASPATYPGKIAIDPELLESVENSNILLVDDEAPVLKTLKRLLESLGHNVTARTSSIEALEAFRAHPDAFDLVISDMTMPNMTGDELAKEIITIRPEMPIIICTGYSNILSEEEALKLGINGFVMKPVVKYELAQKIVAALT